MTTRVSDAELIAQARTVMAELDRTISIDHDILDQGELPVRLQFEHLPKLASQLGHRLIRLAQFYVRSCRIQTACLRASAQLFAQGGIRSSLAAMRVTTTLFGIGDEASKAYRLWLDLPGSSLVTCCDTPINDGHIPPGAQPIISCFVVNGTSTSEFEQTDPTDIRTLFKIKSGVIADPTARQVYRMGDVELEGGALTRRIKKTNGSHFEGLSLTPSMRITLRKDAAAVQALAEKWLPTVNSAQSTGWKDFLLKQLPKTTIPDVEKTLCEFTQCPTWRWTLSKSTGTYCLIADKDNNPIEQAIGRLTQAGIAHSTSPETLTMTNPDPHELRLQALLYQLTQCPGWRLTTSNRGQHTLRVTPQPNTKKQLELHAIPFAESNGTLQLDNPDPNTIGTALNLAHIDSAMAALGIGWPTDCSRIICSYLLPRYA